MLSSAFRFDVPGVFPALPRWPKRLKTLGTRLIYCGKNTATIRWPPGRIKVGRWNERVRAKRCDAVDWDSAYKCRLFSTSVRACDVVCTLVTAAVTELWQLDLFPCSSSSFLCAGTLSPRGKCCYFFCGRFSWTRQTSFSKGFFYYFHDSTTELYFRSATRQIAPMWMLFQNKNN